MSVNGAEICRRCRGGRGLMGLSLPVGEGLERNSYDDDG